VKGQRSTVVGVKASKERRGGADRRGTDGWQRQTERRMAVRRAAGAAGAVSRGFRK
jgi:hypothetical protein